MAAKRQLIAPKGDKPYVCRDDEGRFKESDDVRQAVTADHRRTKGKAVAKKAKADKRWAISNQAAYELLERIAAKAVEPMSDDDPDTPLGQVGAEMVELLHEAINFVMDRNEARAGSGIEPGRA